MTKVRQTSYRGVTLREAGENDAQALFAIFSQSREDLTSAIEDWDPAQKDMILRLQFEARREQYRNDYPQSRFEVVILDGEVIGQMLVACLDDEYRLVDIELLADYRNRGIGSALLQDLLVEAQRSNKPVRLHVLSGNPAIHLYERTGFRVVGEHGAHSLMEWRSSWPGLS